MAFAALPEPAYLLDGQGCVLGCSEAGARVLGVGPDALLGRHWTEMGSLTAPDAARAETERARALTARTGRSAELPWPSPTGMRMHTVQLTPLPHEEGEARRPVTARPLTEAEAL